MNSNFGQGLPVVPSAHPSGWDVSQNFSHASQEEAISRYGIPGRIWEAAYAMSYYTTTKSISECDPPFIASLDGRPPVTLLELGAGLGFVASRLVLQPHDRVIVTDLPEVCTILQKNLQDKAGVFVRPLPWGDRDAAYSIASEFFNAGQHQQLSAIICSDLVYFPNLLAPLLRSLLHLTSPPVFSQLDTPHSPSPLVYISYQLRSFSKETAFWSTFGLWFEFQLVVQKIGQDGVWQRVGLEIGEDIFLFVAQRRPQSYHWSIPHSDVDLLLGVGGKGSNIPKVDDTFENILLMKVDIDE